MSTNLSYSLGDKPYNKSFSLRLSYCNKSKNDLIVTYKLEYNLE